MTGPCENITLPQTSFVGRNYWSENRPLLTHTGCKLKLEQETRTEGFRLHMGIFFH